MKKSMIFTHLIWISAALMGCSRYNFVAQASSSSSGTPSVSTGVCSLQALSNQLKVLFVVDVSGSNGSPTMDEGTVICSGQNSVCAPATDPTKSFRSGSITDFFKLYQAKTNFEWGFQVFSDQSTSYINGFSNAQGMTSALSSFNAETDGGGTAYLAALAAARNAIANDPGLSTAAATSTLYRIIFISDGYPTDAVNSNGTVNTSQLSSAIASILALSPGQIEVSTVYYGTINDPVAASTLQGMATAGGGQFVNADTGSTGTIDISGLITVPTGQCN